MNMTVSLWISPCSYEHDCQSLTFPGVSEPDRQSLTLPGACDPVSLVACIVIWVMDDIKHDGYLNGSRALKQAIERRQAESKQTVRSRGLALCAGCGVSGRRVWSVRCLWACLRAGLVRPGSVGLSPCCRCGLVCRGACGRLLCAGSAGLVCCRVCGRV